MPTSVGLRKTCTLAKLAESWVVSHSVCTWVVMQMQLATCTAQLAECRGQLATAQTAAAVAQSEMLTAQVLAPEPTRTKISSQNC